MYDFDWHDYTVKLQDTGSVFDVTDDFTPELELDLEDA